MGLHRNASLGLAVGARSSLGRGGCSCREAARRRGVSPSTAVSGGGAGRRRRSSERASLACLEDRSSRPHRSPADAAAGEQARICAARRRSGWGPRLIAGETGHPHATVWRTLRRAGISRPPRQPASSPVATSGPVPAICCTSTASASSASAAPATPSPATATEAAPRSGMRVGYEWVHSIVDDHSASPTANCTATNAPTPSPASSSARSPSSPARDRAEAAALRQRLVYRHNRSSRELLATTGSTPLHPATPTADQRQGRALPADAQTRMGTRPGLPLQRPPRPSPVTLARPLQQRRPHSSSAASHRSAASTTSRGRTSRARPPRPSRSARRRPAGLRSSRAGPPTPRSTAHGPGRTSAPRRLCRPLPRARRAPLWARPRRSCRPGAGSCAPAPA